MIAKRRAVPSNEPAKRVRLKHAIITRGRRRPTQTELAQVENTEVALKSMTMSSRFIASRLCVREIQRAILRSLSASA